MMKRYYLNFSFELKRITGSIKTETLVDVSNIYSSKKELDALLAKLIKDPLDLYNVEFDADMEWADLVSFEYSFICKYC